MFLDFIDDESLASNAIRQKPNPLNTGKDDNINYSTMDEETNTDKSEFDVDKEEILKLRSIIDGMEEDTRLAFEALDDANNEIQQMKTSLDEKTTELSDLMREQMKIKNEFESSEMKNHEMEQNLKYLTEQLAELKNAAETHSLEKIQMLAKINDLTVKNEEMELQMFDARSKYHDEVMTLLDLFSIVNKMNKEKNMFIDLSSNAQQSNVNSLDQSQIGILC